MSKNQVFSTRELAQMWNVSESTIKRWADTDELKCYRTPGGHRKFRLDDIFEFQTSRRFEATGLLETEEWEDPDFEVSLNKKDFAKVSETIRYLAIQNQTDRVRSLMERLYLRGMPLDEIYDDVLIPLEQSICAENVELSLGQALLACNNMEEALYALFPQVIRKRRNGKTVLCSSSENSCRMIVNAVCRIAMTEGWDCINLGENVPFQAMAEMVELEPVNLVCVVRGSTASTVDTRGRKKLQGVVAEYRIPLILAGSGFAREKSRKVFDESRFCENFRALKRYLRHATH